MLSPLSRGYGTWTGNYDPYNEEGAVSFKILNFKIKNMITEIRLPS
jgi:hypothetical protein